MKNASQCAGNLRALLRKLRKKGSTLDMPVELDDPIGVLIHSFLLWESTSDRANKAYAALREAFVDENDLRVALPYEIVEVIGSTYPRALDRSQRLRAALNNIYRNEHCVCLAPLEELGKRDARQYLDELEGMVPYVGARTGLLAFDAHGIPVDDQLRVLLIEEGAADPSVEVAELSGWLARQIKASDSLDTHFALQAFVDRATRARRRSSKRSAKKKGSRTTPATKTKKKTRRKTRRSGSEKKA